MKKEHHNSVFDHIELMIIELVDSVHKILIS